MKKATIFNILFIVSIILTSCSKDRVLHPELNEYESLNQFFDDHQEPEQEFIITEDGQCPIVGERGTRLCLGKGNLMRQNADSVQYPFSIFLVELYTPKHMILYRMPNVSDSELIVTGGEIKVRSSEAGNTLLLRQNHLYTAQMPVLSPVSNMSLYYGKDMGSFHNYTTNLSLVAPGVSANGSVTVDSSNSYYNLQLPYLGWNSPNYPYNYQSPKTTISFVSQTDDLTNVAKFLYYENNPSVMQVYGNTSGQIPVGVSVKVICFAKNAQGDMFSFEQQTTAAVGQEIEVTLTQTTEAALLSMLENL
ncbi:MAG: hypothetical protein M3Q58_16260 [Bacteroidota bacterium]|nr:hypothetical protein [Bacteroidota bacterium]